MGPSQVNVTILERLCPLDSCPYYLSDLGRPFRKEEGSLSSPYYPKSYPRYLNKEYNISTRTGKIVIKFTSFNTEQCCDKVTIRDADGTILLRNHSGSRVPAEIISNTNKVSVIFVTDSGGAGSGWSLDWESALTF